MDATDISNSIQKYIDLGKALKIQPKNQKTFVIKP